MEKEPWNQQREGQLPPCKPDQGMGDESLEPVLGENTQISSYDDMTMLIRTMLIRNMLIRTMLMMTKTATCSNPPSPD